MDKNFIQNIQSKQYDTCGKQVKGILAAKIIDTISTHRAEIAGKMIGEDDSAAREASIRKNKLARGIATDAGRAYAAARKKKRLALQQKN